MKKLAPDPAVERWTPENVMQLGQEWIDAGIDAMPAEDVLARFRPEDRLAGLRLEDVLKYYDLEERLTGSDKKEVILMAERKGKASTLLSRLQRRFVDIPDWAREKIARADLPLLEEWNLRVLDAKSLEDVLV